MTCGAVFSAVAQWLKRCATNRKVVGSIPDGVVVSVKCELTIYVLTPERITVSDQPSGNCMWVGYLRDLRRTA